MDLHCVTEVCHIYCAHNVTQFPILQIFLFMQLKE